MLQSDPILIAHLCILAMLQSPDGNVRNQIPQAGAVGRQPIVNPPTILFIRVRLHKSKLLQSPQSGREDVGGDAFGGLEEFIEAGFAQNKIPHDQKRPTIADEVERQGDGAMGTMRHPDIIAFFTCTLQSF